jgi:hypothetical protein
MTTERTSSSIMLDPSLILAQNAIQNTFETVKSLSKENPRWKFYYPASLLQMIHDMESLQGKLSDYFLFNAYPAVPKETRMQFKKNVHILSGFEVGSKDIKRHYEICNNLREDLSYLEEPLGEYIAEILIEEWIFLQEKSWVVSRIKKPFNRFVNAGSVCLQFSGRAADIIINRTLRRERNELVGKVDRLRAFGKWVAVGGPSVLGILNNPVIAVAAPFIAGFFLLFDPSNRR